MGSIESVPEPTTEFKELRPLLTCDNPFCDAKDPQVHCARCKNHFYCSVACQRSDWSRVDDGHKENCLPADSMRAKMANRFAFPVENHFSDAASLCGACRQAVHRSLKLSCGHIFCFTCISGQKDLQGRQVTTPKKACPQCRKPIKDVVDEALRKAYVYLERGKRLMDTEVNERNEMYRLASVHVEQALAADPGNWEAQIHHAEVLMHQDPPRAIVVAQEALARSDVNASAHAQDSANLQAKIAECMAMQKNGQADRADRMMQDLVQEFGNLGSGNETSCRPQDLFKIRVVLAAAYEAAGQYDEAYEEYESMLDDMSEIQQDPNKRKEIITEILHVYFGNARSLYHMGLYDMAIESITSNIQARGTAGFHKLIAQSLAALAEEREAFGLTDDEGVCGHEVSLAGAIEVMYKGFVYEHGWDDMNKKTNKAYLQELLNKQGGGVAVRTETDTKAAAAAMEQAETGATPSGNAHMSPKKSKNSEKSP